MTVVREHLPPPTDAVPRGVQLTAVSKVYGPTVALWRIGLEARFGEVLVVRGENGSGKSTLLRIMAGLAAPSAGEVRWMGGERPRIAYIGHADHLLDDLTVLENLQLAQRLARVRAPNAHHILDELGIATSAGLRCASLSAGTRRRVALARAFAIAPHALFLDEPFGSLDASAGSRLGEQLLAASMEGAMVVMASHELAVSRSVATRTVHLRGGRMVSAADGIVALPGALDASRAGETVA